MQLLDHLQRRLVHPGRRMQTQRSTLAHLLQRLVQATQRGNEARRWRVAAQLQSLRLRAPNFGELGSLLVAIAMRKHAAIATQLERAGSRHARLAASLAHLDPTAVLARGFSIVSRHDGMIVRDSASIEIEEELSLRFSHGGATARVKSKQ